MTARYIGWRTSAKGPSVFSVCPSTDALALKVREDARIVQAAALVATVLDQRGCAASRDQRRGKADRPLHAVIFVDVGVEPAVLPFRRPGRLCLGSLPE